MSIYDISYSNMGKQMLPPDKRKSKNISFITCLLAPIQWLRDLWFGSYRTGSTAPQWHDSNFYAKYNQVIYNKVVYESLIDGNFNNIPSAQSQYWFVVQQNFIGLSERIMYNGQTLVLTYAMNKWFGTTFRQPNQKAISNIARASNVATITAISHGYFTGDLIYIRDISDDTFNGVYQITAIDGDTFTYANTGADVSSTAATGVSSILSDIYILNNALGVLPFIIGATETISSIIYTDRSTGFVINDYSFANRINFTIYVPVAVYTALASTDSEREKIFQSFVNQYIPAGITYQIQTY